MMRNVLKALGAALLAGLVCVTGCTHYTLKPEPPASMPRAAQPPLPLRVGLVLDEQGSALSVNDAPAAQQMLEKNGYVFGQRFAQALRESRLFQDVRYPMNATRDAVADVDMVVSAQFGYKFNQDSFQVPKVLLVCFTGFITGAALTETSHHLAQGVLAVADAAGRNIRSYDETVDVEAESMVSMFAELKTMKLGPQDAADNLIAKLVQNLINDRALFAARPSRAAPSAASAPAADLAAPTAAIAPVSARPAQGVDQPVPAPAAPEPKREPSQTYDDQL
jgi:hypothetical protein